jgi:drug/metabolite transporter (DMT)-like permease
VIKSTTGGVSPSLKGDLEAISAAFFLALYLNYGKVVRNKMNIVSLMMPIYLVASLFVGFGSLAFGNSVLSLQLTPVIAVALIGLGLLPTAVAHTLYFSSLSGLKSFETATLALLEPVGATILGIAAFDEIPAPVFALGAALVLAGIFFTLRKNDRQFQS